MKSKKRAIGVALVLILLMGVLYVGLRDRYFRESIPGPDNETGLEEENKDSGQDKDDKPSEGGDGTEEDKDEPREESKGDIMFLLLGIDDGGRTDTIMVCKYFADGGGVSILSIPRDTRVEIEGRGLDKVNHAHVYGGAELTLKTVNDFLDVEVQDYLRVDFKMVEEIVDILGGVEVDVPSGIYGFEPGVQTLNGEDALELIRHRASYYNQDIGRIDFQQRFLVGLIDQIVASRNLADLASMIRSGRANIDTNISTFNMVRYVMRLRDVDTGKIKMKVLSGDHTMVGRVFYILVDRDEARAMAKELFN